MRCFLLMGVPCKVPLLKGHVSHCIDIPSVAASLKFQSHSTAVDTHNPLLWRMLTCVIQRTIKFDGWAGRNTSCFGNHAFVTGIDTITVFKS